ncbi:hypothetical protein BD779DRAFT_1565653 [Infundibulicybe gibba]|nr:hypothetical protein BD779DRAFT_1565653 [Infundibulicybe gibba]
MSGQTMHLGVVSPGSPTQPSGAGSFASDSVDPYVAPSRLAGRPSNHQGEDMSLAHKNTAFMDWRSLMAITRADEHSGALLMFRRLTLGIIRHRG